MGKLICSLVLDLAKNNLFVYMWVRCYLIYERARMEKHLSEHTCIHAEYGSRFFWNTNLVVLNALVRAKIKYHKKISYLTRLIEDLDQNK